MFLDLDETLVHSRSVLAVAFDLPLLYGSRSGLSLEQMRNAFDREVSLRLGASGSEDLSSALGRVRTFERELALELLIAHGWIRIPTSSEDRIVGLRPGTRSFLDGLAGLGVAVHLCSAATHRYSRSCLEAFGLAQQFDELWTRDDLEAGRARRSERPFLLVDNLPFEEEDVQRKLRCLASVGPAPGAGHPGRHLLSTEHLRGHHVEIVPWQGHDADGALDSGMDRVRGALQRLVAG